MLPAAHRVTDATSFREAVRRGRRAARPTMVAHLVGPGADVSTTAADAAGSPARVGFVVSKAVGNSVVRSRVQRRLRHVARPRLVDLPGGSVLVVRALPASADASSRELGADLDVCLSRLVPAGSGVRT